MKRRAGIALNALLLLLFLGLVYAWSVFKKPLAAQFGWTDSQLTWTFTICMSCFCIGGFLGARLSARFRPQTLVRACAVVIAAAFACTAFITSLLQLYLSYGVLIGGAIGVVYNVVLSTVGRWYPDRPGFISGLLLMAFGTGSLVFGPAVTWALGTWGWKYTMLGLGGLFLLVFFITSFRVYAPAAEDTAAVAVTDAPSAQRWSLSPKQMLRQGDFWLYLVWCTFLCAVGLALVGQAFTIAVGFSVSDMTASYLVGMVSVCNGLGRVLFGSLYDKEGRVMTMLLITCCPLGGAGLLAGAVKTGNLFLMVAAFIFISLGYGGTIPTNANFVRSYFGTEHYATNFSIVNFNILVSVAIGQWLGSGLFSATGSYMVMAYVMLLLAFVAAVINFLIRPPLGEAATETK